MDAQEPVVVSSAEPQDSEPPTPPHSTSSFIGQISIDDTHAQPKAVHSKSPSFSLPSHSRQGSTMDTNSQSLSVPSSPTRPRYNFSPTSSTPASRQSSSRNLTAHFAAQGGNGGPFATPKTLTPTDERTDPFNPPIATILPPPSANRVAGRSDPPGSPSSSSFIRSSFASPPLRPIATSSISAQTTHSSRSGGTTSTSAKKKERMKTTLLDKSTPLEKEWLTKKDPYVLISYLLTYGFILVGAIAGGVRCFLGYSGVGVLEEAGLCLVMDQGFESDQGIFANSNGEGGTFWREVDLSGFGNGEFEMTTSSPRNSFVRDGRLYLMPTLTSESGDISLDQVLDGYVLNATDCTYNTTHGGTWTSSSKTDPLPSHLEQEAENERAYLRSCSAVSNATSGSVINPVQSARLSTRWSASIQYGRVEVKAKLPQGDWLWPAIWMLPVDDAYGPWPLSGEIDIMESRGNGPDYPHQGVDVVRGSLNWGPITWLNSVWRTYGWWGMRRGTWADDFHTYSLEWTEDFIRIYVDTRLHHLLDLRLNQYFWDRGEFPSTYLNGSQVVALQNPWANGTMSAPFDRAFYLLISLGVGSTNGWFPDGEEKPWLDGSQNAMRDFINTRDQWYNTWGEGDDRAFIIDSVKMWSKC